MIRARGIRKSYRLAGARAGELPVLRGVDFDVEDGEFAAVIGRSGSGKSTLLALLGGLDSDYSGELKVAGKDLRTLSDAELSAYRNATIGFVFQAFHLLDHLSCEDNVALPALFRVDGKESKEARLTRARELMDTVGIADKIGARPGTLSGGQKQRLAIARALYHRPKLLICDEPTGNLDSASAAAIIALFRRLRDESGVTLTIVTHDPTIAAAADRVIEIRDGVVELAGGGEEVQA
ncbi:ABC transporter ATP-binding protein [Nannocystis pusilla]|uniref:ABC transporter ATP-binding protein n=1 Tax=Nannocystis pusilla TaxID=889268 RepID=A0ABS7TZM1_9BACT|nr:ABC transporter ATP-binding protein [Nannocystis pusilla]MBZ5713631.1 ABC transporter ATP-binding protein [Nannocystis pusilla]